MLTNEDKSDNNIRVVCRFRPAETCCISIDESSITTKEGLYTFDRVFEPKTNQNQVFEDVAAPIVNDVMKGYNGTIFAYGQTSSGKTYTMMGEVAHPVLQGLTPRVVTSIFDSILKSSPHLEFTVKVSFMEIYMERVRDLLDAHSDNLPIHEDRARGVYVKGLLEFFVASSDEVYQVLQRGSMARVTASTTMNEQSSRSHAIFVLQVTQKDLNTGTIKTGKLSLVDLAGSEKAGKIGATGQIMEEAKKINRSLSTLGMVINALTDGKSTHVPYRDSKLTRILQESLGGNARTALIINCSPASTNEPETLSTLRFGMRAKKITNRAKINTELSVPELKTLLKKAQADVSLLQNQVVTLERELNVWRAGGSVSESDRAVFSHVEEERMCTPIPGLPLDERDAFLRRENELLDQLEEKERYLEAQTSQASMLKDEMSFVKSEMALLTNDNSAFQQTVLDLNLALEKAVFDQREDSILMDTLKEQRSSLESQVQELKSKLDLIEGSKPRMTIKRARVAELLAEMGPLDVVPEMETLRAETKEMDLLTLQEQFMDQKMYLMDVSKQLHQTQTDLNQVLSRRKDVEERLVSLESDYENLLQVKLDQHDGEGVKNVLDDLKSKLQSVYETRQELAQLKLERVQAESTEQTSKVHALEHTLKTLKSENARLKVRLEEKSIPVDKNEESDISADLEAMRAHLAKQVSDFDITKRKLLQDLQDRCERVAQLESSFEQNREEYQTLKEPPLDDKMGILEQNLEKLGRVQKQLVDQNASLKKTMEVAEKKLMVRNERIETLERLLVDTQSKLDNQRATYEVELSSIRHKLKDSTPEPWLQSSRIAKPLRGGGVHAHAGDDKSLSTPVKVKDYSKWTRLALMIQNG